MTDVSSGKNAESEITVAHGEPWMVFGIGDVVRWSTPAKGTHTDYPIVGVRIVENGRVDFRHRGDVLESCYLILRPNGDIAEVTEEVFNDPAYAFTLVSSTDTKGEQ